MTRINLVPPDELCDQHLLAEWRELPRMANFAFKAKAHASIPTNYTLVAGHMKFFLDKGIFLERRHSQLVDELQRRGFKLSDRPPFRMPFLHGRRDYTPTPDALAINRARILERMPVNPRRSTR